IRGFHVTGVQTCALPILPARLAGLLPGFSLRGWSPEWGQCCHRTTRGNADWWLAATHTGGRCGLRYPPGQQWPAPAPGVRRRRKIGRASCRDRGEVEVVE